MAETLHLQHEFGPLYDKNSRVLILGSFPSVKSREMAFYYGHPQNRFWRIIRCLDNPSLIPPDKEHKLDRNTDRRWTVDLPDLKNTNGVEAFLRNNQQAEQLVDYFSRNYRQNPQYDSNSASVSASIPTDVSTGFYTDYLKVRITLILRNHLALWDTIASCTVTGSADSSIKDVIPNDMTQVLSHAPIRLICCNGSTSYNLFMKYAMKPIQEWYLQKDACQDAGAASRQIHPPAVISLPSTSPANAAWSLQKLLERWRVIVTE